MQYLSDAEVSLFSSNKQLGVEEIDELINSRITLDRERVLNDYWHVYQSNGQLEFYMLPSGESGYRSPNSSQTLNEDIIFKYQSFPDATIWLVDNMGYDSLGEIVLKDWDSLFTTEKSLLKECLGLNIFKRNKLGIYKDIEFNFLQQNSTRKLLLSNYVDLTNGKLK